MPKKKKESGAQKLGDTLCFQWCVHGDTFVGGTCVYTSEHPAGSRVQPPHYKKLLPICGVQGWENRLTIIDSCPLQINLPRRNQP